MELTIQILLLTLGQYGWLIIYIYLYKITQLCTEKYNKDTPNKCEKKFFIIVLKTQCTYIIRIFCRE